MERKRFIQGIMGIGAIGTIGSIVYPVINYLLPPKVEQEVGTVTVGTVDEVPKNSGKIFKFGTKPALVIRTSKGEWKAFIAICTHLNCTVQYLRDKKIIWCACHGGVYNLDGINISGPPPRPLDKLDIKIRGDKIVLSKS